MVDKKILEDKAQQIRQDVIKMICTGNAGHTGSSLSDADIMTVLFYSILNIDPKNSKWDKRDRFILSKGHAVESYYCILADLGFFPKEDLNTFSQFGSKYIGHPNNKVNGIEMNTGALGHGLSISVGMALAAKLDKKKYRVFTLMGDGEQAEGSVWEAAMSAAHYKLDNLIGIIDRNRLQISGDTEEVMSLEGLFDKWTSFGWKVIEVDGHDVSKLQKVLSTVPSQKGKPTLVIAKTIKGRGVSFMENVASWHHGVPSDEERIKALEELSCLKEGGENE